MRPPRFETERLVLRPMTLDDYAFMRELDTDPKVCRYLGHGRTKTPDETAEIIKKNLNHYQEHGLSLYLVEEKVSGKPIGRSGLIPWQLETGFHWEVGYTFAHTHWGKGYATEAARFLARYAFESLKANHVISLIHPHNTSSIHVAKKIGMKFWRTHTLKELEVSTYRMESSSSEL